MSFKVFGRPPTPPPNPPFPPPRLPSPFHIIDPSFPEPLVPEDLPEDEPWPPVPPDVESSTLDLETPMLAASMSGMIYRIKGQPSKIFKFRGDFREYQFQKAAGDCAIPVHGKVLQKTKCDKIFFHGFIMDLATPMATPGAVPPSQRRTVMHQMIGIVEQLHSKGIIHGDVKLDNMLLDHDGQVRLCDFGEARYIHEDERLWEGRTTWAFESPNRWQRAQETGREPPPPDIEDDMYGLGLSIWQLYTGEFPFGEIACDTTELEEMQKKRETVNVAEVQDPEAREIITGLLRRGGALV
ncbi:kinase-like domain-containing protein [Chaetomium sp. MPI-SDFR-AT-0129]|nr:kinase-like domain-containing protein [Chaetomium sp. MPI-SDFR-AT-0129]